MQLFLFETLRPGRFDWFQFYLKWFQFYLKSYDGFNTKISIIIEIISNRIEINVISRVNATITIWNLFALVDLIDFNSIWNDFKSIWSLMIGLTLRFQL